jgi:hypothetical protein
MVPPATAFKNDFWMRKGYFDEENNSVADVALPAQKMLKPLR